VVAGLPKVGGTKDPDLARILELHPDLILMNGEENRREDYERLAGELPVMLSEPRAVREVPEVVRKIGSIAGAGEAADALAKEIEAAIEELRRLRSVHPKSSYRFAYLIWRKPWISVNADTFAHALLALAGGENVFGQRPVRYPEVTAEALAEAEPELVLLSSEPFPFEPRHADELARLTGLTRERFVLADGEYLSWHGARTPDGIDYAAGLIADARATRGGVGRRGARAGE